MKNHLEMSVVMPCLNESETIAVCVDKAIAFLKNNNIQGEVLVADNGSMDSSVRIAKEHGARVIHVPMKGYGAALMGGIQEALGHYVIMGDADGSYDFSALMPFVQNLREGNDLVMGNRFWGGIKPGAMPFLHKYLGNPILSFLGRLFFGSPVRDFHCGLRGFHRKAILSLNLRTTGMEYASEMVVKATLNKLKITEVPTVLYPDGRGRSPHLRTWRDGWRHLRFLLLYSPYWLFLYPGFLVSLLGFLSFLWLLPTSREIVGVTFDIGTLLYSAMLFLMGTQSMWFAFMTKAFGVNEGLLPPDPKFYSIFKFINLERGLLIGALAILGGFAASFGALGYWQAQSLGPLNPVISMRLMIPGVVLFVVGVQTVLTSFFMSFLGLPRR